MIKISYDQGKNRVHLEIEGFISLEEAKSFVKESETLTQALKPGYTLSLNTSKMKVMTPDVIEEIKKVPITTKLGISLLSS